MKIWIRTAWRPDKAACVNSKEGLSLQVIPPLCVPWGQLVALVGKSPCNKSLWLVPLCVLTWEFITHGYSGVDPGGGWIGWIEWLATPYLGSLGLKLRKGTKLSLSLRQFCLWLFRYRSVRSATTPLPWKSWMRHWFWNDCQRVFMANEESMLPG